ncbi:putative transcription regulator [Nitrosotalea devaniterrae]|uniref:Putative transcription regulator n=1 Tax=Nitrosotalea devaniterrae TaxID=1078905 RepID=A0A128A1J5_9ARCH|nr:putative transcription regulator [Candidatus Nitrosotalea devanaterra]
MQVLQQGRTLEGKDADNILKIMSNDQALKILRSTIDTPKSAWDISTVSEIPLTQVYRWIRRLHNSGLVRVSGDTNESGKKFFMYQSKVHSIKVTLMPTAETLVELS